MLKIILTTFLLLFELGALLAQNATLNHSKYWFYRTRLRNEFMAVGDPNQVPCGTALGMNIPASSGYEGINDTTGGKKLIYADLHFGDGTSHLGNFMAVLATEYYLLIQSQKYTIQDIDNIKKELFWCMKTFERLDFEAEVMYYPHSGSCANGMNGFFVRDDVDTSIISRIGSPVYVSPGGIKRRKQLRDAHYLEAGYINDPAYLDNVDVNSSTKIPFPSTDQISNLLVGFSFVKKIMNGVNYNGYDLGGHAGFYTSKIMDYYSSNGWDLVIPNTGGLVSAFGGVQSKIMGYSLAKAGQNIFGGKWGSDPFRSGRWEENAPQYSIDAWNCLNWPAGILQYTNNYEGSGNVYNNAISSQLAAIGHSWEYGLVPVREKIGEINIPCTAIYWDNCRTACLYCSKWTGCNCRTVCGPRWASWDCGQSMDLALWHYDLQVPSCLEGLASTFTSVLGGITPGLKVPFRLPAITVNTTSAALADYGYRTQTEIFSLEHRFLHGGKMYYGTNAINDYLNTAPCTGPHKRPIDDPHNPYQNPGVFPQTYDGVTGWQTDNRFEKSNPYQNTNIGGWNGIDYMLLHNLYYSLHGQGTDITGFFNEMNYNLTGTLSSPKTYNGFETLTASNTTISAGADIKLHAGKCVRMNGGFKSKSGANFKAYTQYTFPCDAATGYKDAPQPAPVVLPKTDTPLDSATVVNEIRNELQFRKDSLAPIVQKLENDGKYQPLTEFVKIPVQNPPVFKSEILRIFPNPIDRYTNFNGCTIEYFLIKSDLVKFYVINSFGNQVTLTASLLGQEGVNITPFQFTPIVSGIYTVIMQGSDFTNQYKIIVP